MTERLRSSTCFLQVGHLGFAHRLLELALEFGRHAADLAHPLAERAQHARQFLRPDRDQRDDADDDELAPTDIEHGLVNSKAPRHRRRLRQPLPVVAALRAGAAIRSVRASGRCSLRRRF